MGRDDRKRRDSLDQGRREVGREHGREPEPAKALHFGQSGQQGGEAGSRQEIPAIVAYVHPGERDLTIAGPDQGLDLLDDRLRLLAPAPSARRWHDAEGAAMLAAVLDLHEGPRASGNPGDQRPRHFSSFGDLPYPHLRPVPLDERAQQLREPVLLAIAEHEVHAGHARQRGRVGLGQAAGDDDERGGIRPGDAPYGLAVGEVGAARHRAGIDHVDLCRLPVLDRSKARLLDERAQLLGLDLVEPAAERGKADGQSAAHTVTTSLSWPQAAPMSSPLLQRTVARTPCSSRMAWKPRMRWRGGRWKPEPSQSLNGIRLILARIPFSSRTSRRASSAPSLTPSSSTYSKVMRWRKATGKRRQAWSSSSMAKPLFTGMIRSRISLLVAWREMARLTRRFSLASRSMPLTSPTVDTVMRRGARARPRGSVRMRMDFTVAV